MSVVALERTKTYFEQFVASMPEALQGFTRTVLWPFEQLLEQVAGDPDDLIRGAERFLTAATEVATLAAEQERDRAALSPLAWEGEASQAFHIRMADIEESIRELATALSTGKDVLVEAAEAAVDAFNLLLELIFQFLVAFLIEAIIAAAAALLSAGASVAAFVVRWLSRLAVTLGRGAAIIGRLAQLLGRLATKLDDVKRVLVDYRKRVMELRKLKKQYAPWRQQGRTPEGMEFMKEYQLKVGLPRFAFNQISPVNLPGKGGATLDAAVGVHDIADGSKDRDYVRDGTYSEDIGQYSRSVQNLIDSVG